MKLQAAARLQASREDPSAAPTTYVNLLTDVRPDDTPEVQLLTTDDGSVEPADEQPLLMDDLPLNRKLIPV